MNGDDTLDWAKIPAVPDNRKRAVSKKTIDGSPASRFCPKCALEGAVSPIQLFQINDEEALLMCKDALCTFMQSTYWQSLIVKRSISQLTATISRRKSLSSRSSQVSTPSDTRLHSILNCSSRSRYSVSLKPSPPGISPLPSLSGATVTGTHRELQKLTSFVPPESSLKGKERKTLVPIGPFLSGHAHSFASFQTNKLEHKLFQQRSAFGLQHKGLSPALAAKPKNTRPQFVADKLKTHGKRRACSLDSDSQSSNSSYYDSRPTTPDIAPRGKKVRSIVVPPETLSKLINGSMKLEIRKSKDSGADIIFRSVKKENSANGYSNQVDCDKTPQIVNNCDSVEPRNSVSAVRIEDVTSGGLDITPIGSLRDVVGSGEPQSDCASPHIEAINFQLRANSIKSHIEIINSHIQAINKAVGGSNLYVPFDFSDLCQKFSVDILNEAPSSHGSDQNSLINSTDQGGFEFDRNTSPIDYSSFTPVGYLEKQIVVPVSNSADGNSLLHSNTRSEGLGELQNHSSISSRFVNTQLSSSCS